MAIQQVKTSKPVTYQYMMSRKSFVRGFNEVRTGQPLDYDAYEGSMRDRWEYERGRLFGHVYKGQLKDGVRVTLGAKMAFREAVNAGEIF